MTLRSPVVAMLWELWRVTRAEVAWKLALPIGGGLAVLSLSAALAPPDNPATSQNINDSAAALALILIVLPHLPGWLSMAKLNGGQAGFPLYLGYTRPVRTAVLVGVPMAYLTAATTAMYLVSAMVLRVASGHAFPLLPVAGWIAALTVVFVAAAWSTRSMAIQVVVMTVAIVKAFGWAMDRLTAVEIPRTFDWPPRLWPALFAFPLTDYAWVALIGAASFGVTVAMVGRQRRGDGLAAVTGAAVTWRPLGSSWQWLAGVFRVPCPTVSATRAQVWFDLKSNGLPLLTIGVALAIAIVLMSAVSGPIDAAINADPDVVCPIEECFYWRPLPAILAPFSAVVMLVLGGNAFGIRRRQGRTYLNAFEATQTCGTAQLAFLKLLVKTVCVLAALTAIGVSAWMSASLLGDAVFVQMWSVPLSRQRSAISAAIAALAGYEQLALAVVAAGGVAVWVGCLAALGALWTRYPRRLRIAALLLLVYGVALVLLALAGQRWMLPVGAILRATSWVAAAAVLFGTSYLAWRAFAERLFTVRQASGVVLLSTVFAAAWLTLLRAAGLSLAELPATEAVRMVSPALVPFATSVLAPWSYSRVRHI